ncbi:MAG: hypothetical protein NE330_06010, partial [Lentisphaeraceae bacterium]|nr:hypothetical protein [Lentisphaeraceae bacterium]
MKAPSTNRFRHFLIIVFFTATQFLMAQEESETITLKATSVKAGVIEARYPSDLEYPDITISQFAYGSCNKPTKVSQEFWGVMLKKQPQLMLLLGDQHY